ncbi:ethanolamine transporter [Emticicia oligotrophica DSM 17448]|uniref:Ethanolamine transporter n=1 Tax=Emticicia oligotrophica (strain DSM 17448 / CIP 109782 / MTCC 6937 / GPTSA100-15) TaxID=929562 RepID=A0ABM5N1D7_EMTOG|nr:ethanolamine permease [Emticicia oligotrophica]AFK03181.1 ethanolamine transporter [Emticicia oligotrophica DSM 17448]
MTNTNEQKLQKSLTPTLLWGLGVGYVISGMYFGWNLGLEKGGTLGMAVATFVVIVLYVTFSLSYAELACAIPKAGGAFDYANRALGKKWGFVAGMAQNIEFLFAPPAIAVGIGAYFNAVFPQLSITVVAIGAYFCFTLLNILGTKLASSFELIITILAVLGLIIFWYFTFPYFKTENLSIKNLPNGWSGAFAALPFAIWFFLGIEGLANVAEESNNPQKDITWGFSSAMATLVVLCVLTFITAVGIGGWETIVYKADGLASDSPLPLGMSNIMSDTSGVYQLIVGIGTCGLIASFHGLVLAAGRATFEFGRVGNAPKFMGKVNEKFKTPANALLLNMFFGIIALLSNSTADIIILSAFGALTMYIFSMVSLLVLRKNEPSLKRPFHVPFYPLSPILALIIAVIALVAMIIYNFNLSLIFFGLLGGSFLLALLIKKDW